MIVAFFLGFIMWWILSWLKRRFINPDKIGLDEIYGKLPKEFGLNSKLNGEQKRQTYQEARKKYMEEKNKNPLPLLDEALIHHQVHQEFGYFETDGNEGAFALAERRKQRREALQKLNKEKNSRMEEAKKNYKATEASGVGTEENKANCDERKEK